MLQAGVAGAAPAADNGAAQILGKTDVDSTQYFENEATPAPGSPNIVYIVLDDVGFSDLGSFGSEIRTPNMDSLAQGGLRYNNFHTRAICSPTRAALLTGRNSHTVGVGTVASMNNGFPNGQHRITPAAASIAEVLQQSGYRTFAVGKWHLNPIMVNSSRSHWPLGRGFDQFYGFLDGMTDQYTPDLVRDNTLVPHRFEPGYHLSEDLLDKAIDYVATQTAVAPERPFFLYLAFGAGHAPHQVAESYIEKYIPVFAKGWDKTRADRLARQKQLGIAPADAKLTPSDPNVKPWASLSPKEREVFTRFQATYAGMLEHTDDQIGRLIAFLKKSNRFDNTIFVLLSDNGGSVEGRLEGTLNELQTLTVRSESVDEMAARMDEFGGPKTSQNYPTGWAQASNTPFRFYKTTVWDGGTRTPFIIHWGKGIKQAGKVRDQFIDAVDVTPTMLKLAGLSMPESYKGIAQIPMAGRSFDGTFNDPKAPAPRATQYFELRGQRAIWHDGWRAVAEHERGTPYEQDKWHLFNMRTDFSGSEDVAAKHPELLADLQSRWWAEAGKYGVLPLMGAPITDGFMLPNDPRRQYKTARFKTERDQRPVYVYYPEGPIFMRQEGPVLSGASYTMSVDLNGMQGGEEGAMLASGDQFGGYSFFVKDSRLSFVFNDLGTITSVSAPDVSLAGVRQVSYRFDRTSNQGGTGRLFVDGRQVASANITSADTLLTSLSGFEIGRDAGGHPDDSYADRGYFAFPEGRIDKVTVKIEPLPSRTP
ncbi:MAG: sulfatase-like hydrolase/transferase [Novosphingobium sp.]|nr:sulfatase-like hydrolase/transferase [Novosphingobium sp.]